MIIILDKLASDSYKRVMHVKINRYAVAFYITYIKLCLLPQEYFFNIYITTYLPVFSPLRPPSLKEKVFYFRDEEITFASLSKPVRRISDIVCTQSRVV